MPQRGIGERLLGLCLNFFVACVLLYAGVQLIRAVLPWLLGAAAIAFAAAAALGLLRARRERW